MQETPETVIRNAKVRALDACVGADEFDLANHTSITPFTEWEINFIGHAKDLVDRYKTQLSENEKKKVDEIWEQKALEFDLSYEEYLEPATKT